MPFSKYLLTLTAGLCIGGLGSVVAEDFVPTIPAAPADSSTVSPQAAQPVPSTPPPPTSRSGSASAGGAGMSQSSGRMRLSGTVGVGQAFNNSYTILGLGIGYYWWRGLETGVDFEGWLGDGPNIYKISPEARYLFREFPGPIKPYAGGFYRHTFYEEQSDLDSLGARFGGVLASRGGASLGGGVVYESYMDCDERVYGECDSWYPEFMIFFSF